MNITYTQEQLDIALLTQKNDSFYGSLVEIKNDIRELRNYTIGMYVLIIGSFAGVAITAVCKHFMYGQ